MRKSVAVGISVLALSLGTPGWAQVANDDQTLALASLLDNNSFDRAQLMIAHQLQYWQPVFDTLLIMAPDGSVHANLALEWEYDDTNSVLTLKLREGVTFTDGVPFDAEAVKANLEYLRDGAGQNSFMASTISEIEVIDTLELKLHLSEPDPGLLTNLATVGGAMASPETLGTEGSVSHPIGSGPYIFDAQATVAGRQYVYVRNPDYWNSEAFDFERVTITPMTDLVARLNALKSGQVDAGIGDASSAGDAQANGLEVYTKDVDWLGLTLADRAGRLSEPLADIRVRQALNMAFDKAAILEFFDLGFGRLTDQIFPETSPAYLPELDAVYPYDPDRARELLAEAGYADGFTITMPELPNFANFNPVIEQQLQEIGIAIDWTPVAPNAAIPELRSGRYPAYIMQFGYQGDWAEFRKFAFPYSPWNPTAYDDPDLLELLEEAQYAMGDDQVEKFQDINRYFIENAWFAPWYRRDIVYFANDTVQVEMQTGNVVPFLRNYTSPD
jgi:peptide/nickel transport system substrate-binding protein